MIGKKSLVFNTMLDWRKRDIDKWERAIILREYLDENSISQRQLAEQLGIPKSTIEDWLLYGRLTKPEYARLQKQGLSQSDIYKLLRENKQKTKSRFMGINKLDLEIEDIRKKLTPYLRNHHGIKWTMETQDSLKELINLLNRLLMRIENGNGCCNGSIRAIT